MLSIFSNHQRIQNASKYLSKSSTARDSSPDLSDCRLSICRNHN